MAREDEWLEMRRIAGEDANGQRWDKWPDQNGQRNVMVRREEWLVRL